MEVEVARNSLDCSRDWPVTLVANNSHVVHLDRDGSPPNRVPAGLFLSLLVPQLMRDNPSEMNDERVKVKRRSDDGVSE
jgi:hypothetical protein